MLTRRMFLGTVAAAASAPLAQAADLWVFLGDSITANWSLATQHHAGYQNSGVAGATTQYMLDRIATSTLSYSPFGMVLMGGINDVNGVGGATTTAAIAGRLTTMADMALAANIRVVMCSIISQGLARAPGAGQKQQVIDVNALIQTYVASHARTRYCDYFTPMTGGDGYMTASLSSDGLHPNAAGYSIMYPLTEAAISDVVARPLFPLPGPVSR